MTIPEARQIVGAQLALPAFSSPADLNPEDRERLYDGLAEYIVANMSQFDAAAHAWAGKRIDSPFFRQPIESYGFTDAVASFSGEFAKQAGEIATLKNPFASRIVLGLALGVGLYLAIKAGALASAFKAAK